MCLNNIPLNSLMAVSVAYKENDDNMRERRVALAVNEKVMTKESDFFKINLRRRSFYV